MPTACKSAVATCILMLASPLQAPAAEPPFYVGVAYGAASFDTELDVQAGRVDLLFEPEDDGDSYAVEIGYQFDPDWFIGIEYQRIDADDTEIDNWLASLNYRWPLGNSAAFYAGVLAGASSLDWQDEPIDAINRDRENEEPLWGVQTGFSYDFDRRWRVHARYQFMAQEHETRLEPNTGRGKFNHEEFHNVMLGIQLRF